MTAARSLRRMGVLFAGSGLAQVLTLAAVPLIGRYYTPSELGLLGVLSGLSVPLMGVAALRYDLALLLPEDERRAAAVLVLSLLTTGLVSLLLLAVAALARAPIAAWVEASDLADWLFVCPALVGLGGLSNTLGYWITRQRGFRTLAGAAVATSSTTVGAQVTAGVLRLGAGGLVFGMVLGKLVGVLGLAAQVVRGGRGLLRSLDGAALREVALEYSDFPRLQAPSVLLNHALQHWPTYVLGVAFGREVVGQWSLAFMALTVPAGVLIGAIRQVLLQEIGELRREGRPLAPRMARWMGALYGLGLPVTLGFAAVVEPLFARVFGPGWELAGELAPLLVLWLLTGVGNAPVSAALPILRLNRLMLAWQVLSVVVVTAVMWWATQTGDAWAVTAAFCGAMIVLNVVIAAVVFRAAHVSDRDIAAAEPSRAVSERARRG